VGGLYTAGIFASANATAPSFFDARRISFHQTGKSVLAAPKKLSTTVQRLNKEIAMKKPFILCFVTLLAIVPVCFGQAKPAKSGKSAPSETAIADMEKSAWEAYKNKQADAFKALMSKDYYGVYAEGVKTLDAEVADMAKSDLREYSFADVKVVFPHPKVAVVTYKATVQASADGKDVSGTYNSGSVWVQKGQKWIGAFHSESKAP
jgi:hypothetical protein